MTILVTGAYGFLGRHVARALAQEGHAVTGIGHGSWDRSEWRNWGIDEWHSADVTLASLGEHGGEPALIVHCAGSGSVPYSVTHPRQDFSRTVESALDVLEFMRTAVPQSRLVIPSSAAVYGAADVQPIVPDAARRPASPYGVHKAIVEDACRSYARHFDLKIALVRLFSVHGTGLRKQLLWDACRKMQAGDFSFMGTGRETRDLIHVEDASRLLIAAASQASSDCPAFNGGSGQAIEVGSILDAVADALSLGARPRFTGQQRAGDPQHYQAEIGKSIAIGWRPSHDWREDVSSYVAWYGAGAP